jgi:hypothetical protein
VDPPDAPTDPPFAGDLLLALARQGRLVLDAARADATIAELERTLSVVHARLRTVERHRRPPAPALDGAAVDALFAELLAPGRLERAAVELPKYIEALRSARHTGADLE